MSLDYLPETLDTDTAEAVNIDRSIGDFTFPERNKFVAAYQKKPSTTLATSKTILIGFANFVTAR